MSITIDLTGKVVIVTGSGSGIGLSIAKKFLDAGANVVINDIIDEEEISDVLAEYANTAIYVKADISTQSNVDYLIYKALSFNNKIDILINNAAIVSDWDKSYGVNVKGQFYCTEKALTYMTRGGKVIFLGSASSDSGGTGIPQYVATKGAANSLMRFFAREYGHRGINVNTISPAVIKTPMLQARYESEKEMENHYSKQVPIGRMGTPSDVANLALFLGSNLSDYIHAQIIYLDGGRLHVG